MPEALTMADAAENHAVATQCPFCSVQCKISLTELEALSEALKKGSNTPGASVFKAEGLFNHASEGRACVKGLNAHQHSNSSERILFPMVRKKGVLTKVGWDEALGEVERRLRETCAQYGNDAVGVYGGGSLTNETAYLLGKFARLALGTRFIDYNGRFCMSAAASAGVKSFGLDRGLTFRLEDIAAAECIILAGTNVAECQPTLMPYFNRAKENGANIIVIDPRVTQTAAAAALHIQNRPGTDAALAAAMLSVLMEEDLIDKAFIAARTNGFEELAARVKEQASVSETALFCGVEESAIREAALLLGRARTAMIMTARGVEQQTDGHLAVREFINLLLATGNIGREGCGYGAITGQANGQGGREHGQKADQLPGYRLIENEADRAYIASVWDVEEARIPRAGVSAYEMMERVANREVRNLFIMGSNPVVSNPNAVLVEEGIAGLDHLIVADMFMSETARYADVVLPVTSYLENEGTLTNLEGRVLLREAGRTAPGETRHDWQILCHIAAFFGEEQRFQYESAEQIFQELRVASRGGRADYYGITYDRIRSEGGVYWPCPDPEGEAEALMFRHRFAHPDGKAMFSSAPLSRPAPFSAAEALERKVHAAKASSAGALENRVHTAKASSAEALENRVHTAKASSAGALENRVHTANASSARSQENRVHTANASSARSQESRSQAVPDIRGGNATELPLILTNGRILAHYLTGVQTRRSPSLSAREVGNFLEIHPSTARRLRIADGEWVEVETEAGMFSVRSRLTDKIREDTVFSSMHWGGIQNVNRATLPELDPFCKMPGFKYALANVRPLRGK
jgi:assimilatory nitrate reductase catalytic subunit